jgi:hypothetical protein
LKKITIIIAALCIVSCAESEKKGEAYPPATQKGEIEYEKRMAKGDTTVITDTFPEDRQR